MFRWLEYAAARALVAGLQAASAGAGSGLARAAARIAYALDAVHRKRAAENLDRAYAGTLSGSRIRELTRRCFEQLAVHATGLLQALWRREPAIAVAGAEILRRAHAEGRGVIVVSAHLGPFGLLGCLAKELGIPATVVLKRQKNARLLRWFASALRRRFGVEVLLKPEVSARAGGVLREGRALVLYADQYPIAGGVPATFFGRPVLAPPGPAVLARRYRAPLLVGTVVSGEGGAPAARFDGPVSTSGTTAEVTQRWLDLLEERIREHPEQWLWMHRRWRA